MDLKLTKRERKALAKVIRSAQSPPRRDVKKVVTRTRRAAQVLEGIYDDHSRLFSRDFYTEPGQKRGQRIADCRDSLSWIW